jgi:hypothetical protein
MWLRVAVAAWGLAGCRFDADPGGAAYACAATAPVCPDGLVCADGRCREPISDAGETDDGAAIDAALASAYAAAVLADEPILYLRLDDQGTEARDSSPAARDGVYLGGVAHLATGALAEANGAAAFDGDNDQIGVSDAAALRLNGDFTIEFWARAAATELAYPGVVRKGDPTFGGTGYLIYYRGNEVHNLVFKRNGMDNLEAEQTPLSAEVFHHYALVYRAVDKELVWYADGELDTAYDAISFDQDDDEGELYFARGDSFGAEALDEIAFYDHALGRDQLALHLDAAQGP